jgi:phage/plasmid-associated DNA primase
LEHVGESLTPFLQDNEWAKENNLVTGADYLLIWIASLIQAPVKPLPYLFLYGPQNTGKSILHEALSLLFTTGVERGDRALTLNYNAELRHAVLCVIEETNLQKNKEAYNRVKDYVTSPIVQIHEKYLTPYNVVNTTHWIQTANEMDACPIDMGDTRITMIHVGPLSQERLIPKAELIRHLENEAPAFLARLVRVEIPPSKDRLNLPVIETASKSQAMSKSIDAMSAWTAECLEPCSGNLVKFGDMYDNYVQWCAQQGMSAESLIAFAKAWPIDKYPKGVYTNNVKHVGDVKFAGGSESASAYHWVVGAGGRLRKVIYEST